MCWDCLGCFVADSLAWTGIVRFLAEKKNPIKCFNVCHKQSRFLNTSKYYSEFLTFRKMVFRMESHYRNNLVSMSNSAAQFSNISFGV